MGEQNTEPTDNSGMSERKGTGYGFAYNADIVRIIAQPTSNFEERVR